MSVIIVGGGMAGATLALAISRLSHGALPVHLIEATAPESHAHPGFDGRAIALAAGTCQQLARIGVWQSLADCATAITTVHVSDRGHAGFVTLAAEDYQLAALGQVVELHNVGQRLFALLRKAPGVTLHCPDRVANVARTQSHVEVTLESGETLTGRGSDISSASTYGGLVTIRSYCTFGKSRNRSERIGLLSSYFIKYLLSEKSSKRENKSFRFHFVIPFQGLVLQFQSSDAQRYDRRSPDGAGNQCWR